MLAVAEIRIGGLGVMAATFFLALTLSVVTMPDTVPDVLGYLRPDWVGLVLIYWVIALPHRIGLGTAWGLGILLDVLLGSLLGQHATALVVVAYIAINLYQRMRMFSVWQQGIIVFAMITVSQLIIFWIESLATGDSFRMWFVLPALVSAFIWPWIFLSMRYLRRKFDIT